MDEAKTDKDKTNLERRIEMKDRGGLNCKDKQLKQL